MYMTTSKKIVRRRNGVTYSLMTYPPEIIRVSFTVSFDSHGAG